MSLLNMRSMPVNSKTRIRWWVFYRGSPRRPPARTRSCCSRRRGKTGSGHRRRRRRSGPSRRTTCGCRAPASVGAQRTFYTAVAAGISPKSQGPCVQGCRAGQKRRRGEEERSRGEKEENKVGWKRRWRVARQRTCIGGATNGATASARWSPHELVSYRLDSRPEAVSSSPNRVLSRQIRRGSAGPQMQIPAEERGGVGGGDAA